MALVTDGKFRKTKQVERKDNMTFFFFFLFGGVAKNSGLSI